jgi:hypothetical protein
MNIIDISSEYGGDSDSPQSKFGGGIELLMNDGKKTKTTNSGSIDIEDLDKLESELDELVHDTNVPSSPFINTLPNNPCRS